MNDRPRSITVKLNVASAQPANYGTYKVESKYDSGDLGYILFPASAIIKLKQAMKQVLVFGVDGARFQAELPGVTFTPYPGSKLTTYHSRTHSPRKEIDVESVEILVWHEGVSVLLFNELATESCQWEVTDQLQEVRDEVYSRFYEERKKREEWLTQYKKGGKKPLMNLSGAPRGRKKKKTNDTES